MIIIPTHTSRVDTWLSDCLNSLNFHYLVTVLFQGEKPEESTTERLLGTFPSIVVAWHELNGYDPGALVYAVEEHVEDDVFVLHDSCVIKDNSLFDLAFIKHAGKGVALSTHPTTFGMFLGKYRYDVLKDLPKPLAQNKYHGIELEESWNRLYCQADPPVVLFNDFNDKDIFETKHGRKNMVIENKYLKKYKGAWNRSMVC